MMQRDFYPISYSMPSGQSFRLSGTFEERYIGDHDPKCAVDDHRGSHTPDILKNILGGDHQKADAVNGADDRFKDMNDPFPQIILFIVDSRVEGNKGKDQRDHAEQHRSQDIYRL